MKKFAFGSLLLSLTLFATGCHHHRHHHHRHHVQQDIQHIDQSLSYSDTFATTKS